MFNKSTLYILNFSLSIFSLFIYLIYINPFNIIKNNTESKKLFLLYSYYYYYLFLITISFYEYINKNIKNKDFMTIIIISTSCTKFLLIYAKNDSFKEISITTFLYIWIICMYIKILLKNKFLNNNTS